MYNLAQSFVAELMEIRIYFHVNHIDKYSCRHIIKVQYLSFSSLPWDKLENKIKQKEMFILFVGKMQGGAKLQCGHKMMYCHISPP